MRRFFIDGIISNEMTLEGENHRHLSYVLRAKKGDEIVLCNGDGYDCTAVVNDIKKDKTAVSVVRRVFNDTEPALRAALFFAVLKGDKNDLVVQKATELGVREIRPFFSENVSAHPSSVRCDRLNKIALESCKQCGRAVLPRVYEPQGVKDVAARLKDFDTVLFLYEKSEACGSDIKSFLRGRVTDGSAAIIIGSEGGFTDEEARLFKEAGAEPVTIGKRILRAETASIAALSILMYEAGQMK